MRRLISALGEGAIDRFGVVFWSARDSSPLCGGGDSSPGVGGFFWWGAFGRIEMRCEKAVMNHAQSKGAVVNVFSPKGR